MKQQIIELKKKLLLVEIGGELSKEFLAIMNEHGMAEILGKLTDITESIFDGLVEKYNWGTYANYGDKKGGTFVDTAKESFFSKLEAEEIYFENKYEKPNKKDFELNPNNEHQRAMIIEDKRGQKPTWQSIFYKNYQDKLKTWQEAQEKVWNKDNTFLFEIYE